MFWDLTTYSYSCFFLSLKSVVDFPNLALYRHDKCLLSIHYILTALRNLLGKLFLNCLVDLHYALCTVAYHDPWED